MSLKIKPRTFWYQVLAASAWIGFSVGLLLTLIDYQPSWDLHPDLTLFNYHPGFMGVFARTLDFMSYFTLWSNLAVAIIFTKLARNPEKISKRMLTLIPTSLLMITVTGILYNALIAPSYPPHGFFIFTSFFEHILTPLLALYVWFTCGPHLMSFQKIGHYFIVPIAYLIYTLARGAVIHQYPYGFLNAAKWGYRDFTIASLEIMVFSLLTVSILVTIDRRRARQKR